MDWWFSLWESVSKKGIVYWSCRLNRKELIERLQALPDDDLQVTMMRNDFQKDNNQPVFKVLMRQFVQQASSKEMGTPVSASADVDFEVQKKPTSDIMADDVPF